MAVMSLSKNMVFWKIMSGSSDLTSRMNKYVSSIAIKDILYPTSRVGERKDPDARKPSSATISVTSHDYIEDIFTEGLPMKIYMGYTRDLSITNLVFDGKIVHVPDGSAGDMLQYKIKLASNEIQMAFQQKNRVLQPVTKASIIAQIAAENNRVPRINITDNVPIRQGSIPMQRAMTDLELLFDLADRWDCVFWLEPPNFLYFQDSRFGHATGGNYVLGYRTDIVKSNVESISWKQQPKRAGTPGNSGIRALNERGETDTNTQYRILSQNNTYELREIEAARAGAKEFWDYAMDVKNATLSGNAYDALRRYYHIVDGGDLSTRDTAPSYANSGFDIEINLNEGDPSLKPPKNILLFAGTNNPRVDTAKLPRWLFRHSAGGMSPAILKLNRTDLRYSQGKLQQKLTCTISASTL